MAGWNRKAIEPKQARTPLSQAGVNAGAIQMTDGLIDPNDEDLIRWVALALGNGKSESEIRRTLGENTLFDSRPSPSAWKSLMFAGISEAKQLRSLVISRAELGSTDWLRLDSYARRKQGMQTLQRLIEQAEPMADSVSKMNSVSFMVGGLMNAQDKMDKLTGAVLSQPKVQVNISYDPLDQFRGVIQAEASAPRVIDIAPADPSDRVESEADFTEEE